MSDREVIIWKRKKIENLYCLIEALYDVKDAFKAIVFLTCAVFIIWYSSVIVSRAFAIALFCGIAAADWRAVVLYLQRGFCGWRSFY